MFERLKSKNRFVADVSSSETLCIGTYLVLFSVSAVMTVLNIFTDKGYLTCCTGIFSLLCLINIGLTIIGTTPASIAKVLFAVEVLCMFTFFLISGNPDGFSAIWICMLPSLGMFFFNRVRGSILCAGMFVILVFLFWTPLGNHILLYDYNQTFKMRFPILFIAFHALAFLLESLRMSTYNEMIRLQDYYRDLSSIDLLTNLFNRQGMYESLEKDDKYRKTDEIIVAMFDLDDYKKVNDKYGHRVGDIVLSEFADILKKNLDAIICRWGGEEFVAIFTKETFDGQILENIRKTVEEYSFTAGTDKFNITTSIGVGSELTTNIDNIDFLITKADNALYDAKAGGKNKIVYYK